MEPVYLAIDPGETAGWAHFNEQGDPIAYGQFKHTDAVKELDKLFAATIKVCICEDFKNYPWMQKRHGNSWGDNKTSQMIGQIDMMCQMRDVKLVKQMSNLMQMGFMYMGMEMPKDHSISHQFCALAHGVYYLQTEGITQPGKYIRDE